MAFSLSLIIILGLSADYLFKRFHLPGLVGMLIAGILVGPYVFDLMSPEMMAVSGDFRKIALVVILLRAGFELRRDTLHRVGIAAIIMSSVPAIFEIAGVVLIAPWLLGITWLEATILGCILAAVSPAVVVPLMIDFMDRGMGAKKGIPTLILGASSVDDVFVIVLFSVFLGMHGGGDANLAARLAEIPISIVLGIFIGLIPGYMLYRLFISYDWRPPKRTLVVLGTAIILTWIEDKAHGVVPIAGLLGVMALGFMILEKSESVAHLISQKLKKLWVFAELLLFVLVGAQVNIHVAWKAGLAGTAVILVGLIFRSVGTYLSLLGAGLTHKERLFCVVAYIPKATVQAAIGAVPLAAGVASGEVILAVAVMSILITAPLGAVGIMVLGERVLEKEDRSVYKFKELRNQFNLPRVGERVRDKHANTVWKVIEEKEEWIKDAGQESEIPGICLRFWKEGAGPRQGTGKTRSSYYIQNSSRFEDDWEILYDW